MGIRGLTRFITQNALLEKYKLHDTNLVIDGNTIYRQLYQIHSTERNSCFGGDYDKFADFIDGFFEVLDNCKVVPYVVFQGGIEQRGMKYKMKKVSSRLESVKAIDSTTDESDFASFLPFCIGDVFLSIVLKRNIKTVRCDFESITTTLSISKTLNCPILSYDSDFFMCSEIFYIPFQSLCESSDIPYPHVVREIRTGVKYIPCQIFKVDRFLEKLGLTGDKLPLLAAMLGNTFIDIREFPRFYLWPHQTVSFQSRISNMASWLRTRSVKTAEEDILNLTRGAERVILKSKLEQATKSYKCFQSKYVVNLGLLENSELPENEVEMENNSLIEGISEVFLQNFRKCRYTAHLMEILVHNWYGNFKPLPDKMNLPHSHTLSEDILSAIQKILTNAQTELECVVRVQDHIVTKTIPLCRVEVPTFLEIQEMNVEDRKFVVLRILGLDFLSEDSLRVFPESWQLFMIVLLYMQRRSSLTWPLCYSLILCKTILEQEDEENGRLIRCCEKTFNKTRGKRSIGNPEASKILREMDNFITYFKMRVEMRLNSDLYDQKLVYEMSQFQSCLYHIKVLNDLLNMPFAGLLISNCFNGTFIYNFSKILEEQTNIDDFIEMSLLQHSPTIITTVLSLLTELKKIKKQ